MTEIAAIHYLAATSGMSELEAAALIAIEATSTMIRLGELGRDSEARLFVELAEAEWQYVIQAQAPAK